MNDLRIHIFGPSGAGTTTLGAALAAKLGCPHFDSDAYFWLKSDPPFRNKRPAAERDAALQRDLAAPKWVLSGSVMDWSDKLPARFTAAVFLELDSEERLQRLREREKSRYGDRIARGGDMYETFLGFMSWAAEYDEPDASVRSKTRHKKWIANLACPVIRVPANLSTKDEVAVVLAALK